MALDSLYGAGMPSSDYSLTFVFFLVSVRVAFIGLSLNLSVCVCSLTRVLQHALHMKPLTAVTIILMTQHI